LVEDGLNARSVNRKLASLRTYYKFLIKQGTLTKSPTEKVKPLKTDKSLPVFVNESDLFKLLDKFEFSDDFGGKRDRLILEILYGTGIRLSELLSLKDSDIQTSKNTIKVLGKRNKERIIPMTNSLKSLISDYLEIRNKTFEKTHNNIFLVTNKGTACYPMFVYRIVGKYLNFCTTIEKKSPHVLRHTFATHLLNKGADLNAVKDLLGHAGLAATQVYTHNSLDKIKKVFNQAHPKA
jgi:integrase/recombinase XerC